MPLVGPVTMPTDESGWWEQERATFIRSRLRALSAPGSLIVDVGCGRGSMLDPTALPGRGLVNVDGHLWDEWRNDQPGRFHVCAHADALPFRDGCIDLVGSFDVLEHLPDDGLGIAEQRRIVRDSGAVVTAVPADMRLWSGHDEAVGHWRRYSNRTMRALTEGAGLDVTAQSYFFSFLWLPARLMRTTTSRSNEPGTGASLIGRLVRAIVGLFCRIERRVMQLMSLPLGTSLWTESRPSQAAIRTRSTTPLQSKGRG